MELSIVATVLSLGLITIGTAFGVGKIGSRALESMARQPENSSNLRTSMLLAIAAIEGVAILAVIACFIVIVSS